MTKHQLIAEQIALFVEKGADIEHTRWAKWQKYLHSKGKEYRDGTFRLPLELYKRWERQINTSYAELSEEEKESDRREVRSYTELLSTALSEAYAAGAKAELDKMQEGMDKITQGFAYKLKK